MMATVAFNDENDISRAGPYLCEIDGEDEENYIGQWVEGFGFLGGQFPRATTRELTDEEEIYHNGRVVMMGTVFIELIHIPDAPNTVPIPDGMMVVYTRNSIYRFGKADEKGVRAVAKAGATLPFDQCIVKSLMLDRPLVLINADNGSVTTPLVSSKVERIETHVCDVPQR